MSDPSSPSGRGTTRPPNGGSARKYIKPTGGRKAREVRGGASGLVELGR